MIVKVYDMMPIIFSQSSFPHRDVNISLSVSCNLVNKIV